MRIAILAFCAVGLLVLLLVFKARDGRRSGEFVLPSDASIPDRPVGFGFKIVWFAVKTGDARAVASALGYRETRPCNWKTGIERAYGFPKESFITPPVAGWTLVAGSELPAADAKGSEASVAAALEKLSREFGEAQWFASHRVVEYHGWAKAVNGRIIRHYSYLGERGETLSAVGAPTPAEPLHLFNSLSSGPREPGDAESKEVYPDEMLVMKVAGAWSIDPTTLDNRTGVAEALGLLAR